MTAPAPVIHPLTVRLRELGDRTARQILELLDQLAAGALRPDQLPELAGVLLKLGADQAAALTVADLVAELRELGATGAGLPPTTGITATTSQAGAERAVSTIMAGEETTRRARLERLARGAVTRAGQDGRETALRQSPLVTGWTRGLDSTACQLCVWWWREGRVWPKSHHMPRHPGCTCVQVPAVTRGIRGLSDEAYTDSAERRRLEREGRYMDAFGTDRRHNKE